ncbi:MAG TPA: Uma2 family endonuclease [Pirellulales bacterium]|nr:Uma2 family endonuclease [Pirellulales bacterium]HVC96642.1 Uma2 family endonuclease [Pirellulales bacterium]
MSISMRPPPGTTADPLYPDSDGKPMGETEYHILAITHLYEVLRPWFRGREGYHVAADMLLYYEQGNPSAVRGPDVMVSKGVRGKHLRRSFRTWEEGVAPAAIIEVTSRSTKDEDQFEKPAVYARIGVKEYFLFDPIGEYLRPRLQGFRLVDGVYVPMAMEQADRLSSGELGLDLVADAHLLRVVDPASGKRLPTGEEYQEQLKLARREAREAKRAAAEARRQTAEAERRAADVERKEATALRKQAAAQKAAAEAQNEVQIERRRSAELEAEIARLRSLLPPCDAQ